MMQDNTENVFFVLLLALIRVHGTGMMELDQEVDVMLVISDLEETAVHEYAET